MHDDMQSGVCAAADLWSRLAAEVARAAVDLEAAECRYRDALAKADPQAIPLGLRADVATGRRRLAALQNLLDGILTPDGGPRARSA